MKILGGMVGVTLAMVIALPGAQARPRLGGLIFAPLAIVGGIAGAALGSRKARAHRAHQYRHNARRDRGRIRQARPSAPASGEPVRTAPVAAAAAAGAGVSAVTATAGWSGPLFWPHAYDGVFEYTFGLPGESNQFWSRGFGDVIDGMFVTPVRETTGSGGSARAWENLCGAEAPQAADVTIARIRETVQPTPAQQASLKELHTALSRAIERIESACPSKQAATPPERLYLMIARLGAMRQAVLFVQAPLRNFYDQLDDRQKAALEQADANAPNAGCAAPVANWPQPQIERALRPTQEQRAYLEQLRQTSLGLAQFVASTCPRETPRTAPARLEAIKERLAVLRYAASNVAPAYEQFYGSLSDAQKARFQSVAPERRADSRR